MHSFDWLLQIKFNSSELYAILADKDFDRHRAGRWMDDHILFAFQVWNFSIALLSGVCAAAMTPEFLRNMVENGFNATLCSTREEVFTGTSGLALFILLFARLPEFIDTLFIILRKQPLLFIHYYHHAFTLCFAWSTYSYFTPAMRHPAYVNALIHTVMYSYYFATTLNIRPPPIVARCITIAQIVQFIYIFYGLVHVTALIYVFGENCLHDPIGLAWTWFMDLSYLYLFIDFYLNKYKGTKKQKHENENGKKME